MVIILFLQLNVQRCSMDSFIIWLLEDYFIATLLCEKVKFSAYIIRNINTMFNFYSISWFKTVSLIKKLEIQKVSIDS